MRPLSVHCHASTTIIFMIKIATTMILVNVGSNRDLSGVLPHIILVVGRLIVRTRGLNTGGIHVPLVVSPSIFVRLLLDFLLLLRRLNIGDIPSPFSGNQPQVRFSKNSLSRHGRSCRHPTPHHRCFLSARYILLRGGNDRAPTNRTTF